MHTRMLVVIATVVVLGLGVTGASATTEASTHAIETGGQVTDHDVNGTDSDVAAVFNVSAGFGYSGFEYSIDGEDRPELTLTEGETYEFHLEGTVAGHPFHLSRDPNGGSNDFPARLVSTGVEVTDSYQGNDHAAETGVFRVTVPEGGFGNDVYYQCGVHTGMGAEITVVSGPKIPALPDATGPPEDVDNDTQLEDVDGDGTADVFDVLTYYNNRDNSTIRDNTDAFDYDGDGTAGTVFDALALYEQIS